MRKGILGVGLLLLALGLVAAACGGSEEKETTKQTSTPGQVQTVDVELGDYYFEPKDLSGDVGKAVTVQLKNEGKAAHSFTIDELGVDQTVQPGQEARVTFTPTQGGSIAFYCKFHGASGMEGTLTVSGGSAGAAPGAPTSSPSSGGGSPGYGIGY